MNYKTRQPFPHAAYVEGQRNFTYFDRSLTSGLTDVIIESPGDFLYIDQASTGVVSVELNMRQGGTLAPILLAAGGSIECDFASIKLNATAQLNKSVRVIVGNGARIKAGGVVSPNSSIVSVVDGSRFRTQQNTAFMGFAYCAGVGGKYPNIQLYNPSASGKNIFLETFDFEFNAAASYYVRGSAANLATLTSYVAASKKIGGSNSSVAFYTENSVSLILGDLLCAGTVAAGVVQKIELLEPLLIAPGYGVHVTVDSAAAAGSIRAQLYEE